MIVYVFEGHLRWKYEQHDAVIIDLDPYLREIAILFYISSIVILLESFENIQVAMTIGLYTVWNDIFLSLVINAWWDAFFIILYHNKPYIMLQLRFMLTVKEKKKKIIDVPFVRQRNGTLYGCNQLA